MPKTMFQNSILNICQRVLFSLVIAVIFVNCKTKGEFEQDCILPTEKDCDRLKAEGIDESYTFLVDTTWLNYTSYEEKLQACQIPDSTLEVMCTYSLVKTCLVNYPFLLDLTVLNDKQAGFDRFKNTFNGIQQLIQRCDGGLEIIEYYKNISAQMHPDSIFTYQSAFVVYCTEIFLAQIDFFGSLSEKERLSLFVLALNIRELKLKDDRLGVASTTDPNSWIISRIMVFENYEPFIKEVNNNQNLKHFIETMHPIDVNSYMEIDSLIHKYSNEFIKS